MAWGFFRVSRFNVLLLLLLLLLLMVFVGFLWCLSSTDARVGRCGAFAGGGEVSLERFYQVGEKGVGVVLTLFEAS